MPSACHTAGLRRVILTTIRKKKWSNMIDLSILVCSVHTRYDNFLLKIEKQLFDQYKALSEPDQHRVEIVVLTDNKMMMLGHKRNVMVELAQGKYIVFVDDDDRISDDYI